MIRWWNTWGWYFRSMGFRTGWAAWRGYRSDVVRIKRELRAIRRGGEMRGEAA